METTASRLRKSSAHEQKNGHRALCGTMACTTPGCSKRPSGKAAGESKPETYPQGYGEDFDEPRTKLADFFSILIDHVGGAMPVNMDPAKKRKRQPRPEAVAAASEQATALPGKVVPFGEETEEDRVKDLAEAELKNLWEATEVIDMDKA